MIVGAVVLVVLLVVGGFVWNQQRMIAAQRAQAQARLKIVTQQFAHIEDLEDQYSKFSDGFYSMWNAGRTAGQRRHDSSDDDVIRGAAKSELADVVALQGKVATMRDSLDATSDAFAAELGDGPLSNFRSDADQYVQTTDLSLNRWWRAINDIVDSIVRDEDSTENLEQLYDESDDYESRAMTQRDALLRNWQSLQKQAKGRVDQATKDLAQIR